MFNIFKRKKTFLFKKDLKKLQNSGYKNIGVTIYKNEQVLVQIMLSKHFENKSLECNSDKELCLIIDFNKNRTETWSDFKNNGISQKLNDFVYFEEPKGIHCYVKNIGQNPKEIEDYMNQIISEVFTLKASDKLGIEFRAA